MPKTQVGLQTRKVGFHLHAAERMWRSLLKRGLRQEAQADPGPRPATSSLAWILGSHPSLSTDKGPPRPSSSSRP